MNAKHEEVTCLLNFGGFYGYHDEYIDDRIFQLEIQSANVDYKQTYKNYAKEWLKYFNSEANLELKYDGLESPRFYNFSTDKIIAKVTGNEAQRLIKEYLHNDKFKRYANDRLTSRSGFISFYNGFDDLLKRSDTDDNDYSILVNLILDFIIIDSKINEYIYELEYDIETNE